MGDAEVLPTPAGGVDTELPRRRDTRPGVQRRPVPWLVIVGLLLLLVLVGRGLVGAVLGRDGTTSTALVTVGPTTGGSVAPSDPTATGSGGSALIVPTVAPTPPPSSDRLILPLASPSATVTGSPTSSAASSPTASAPGVPGTRFVGVQSGRCIDVTGGSTVDFTRMELLTCNGSAGQAFTYTAASELRVLGKCMDAQGQSTGAGTPIILYSCNGQLNQKWTFGPGGTIRGVQSNRCIGAAFLGRSDGTPLELWDCNGSANQAWSH